jgi:predicted GIY-YIG superfamily endonuclease
MAKERSYYTYELINFLGTIEYVGQSYRPEYRFRQHTLTKSGKFFGRQDLYLHVVAEYPTRKEALLAEGQLKAEHHLEWTERTHLQKAAQKNVENGTLERIRKENWIVNREKMLRTMQEIGRKHTESGHIQKVGAASMSRLIVCPHCKKEGKGAIMWRWHFLNCKKNPIYAN